jgi:hypothetical protein
LRGINPLFAAPQQLLRARFALRKTAIEKIRRFKFHFERDVVRENSHRRFFEFF